MIFTLARGVSPTTTIVLSFGLLLAGLNLSAYYYSFLAVVPLVFRDRPREIGLLFAGEALIGLAHLFEHHEVVLYLAKSFLLAVFWIAVFLLADPGRFRRKEVQIDSASTAQIA